MIWNDILTACIIRSDIQHNIIAGSTNNVDIQKCCIIGVIYRAV